MKIGFLASHGGSNMQAIIDACKAGSLDAEPVVVISNNGSSRALERAGEEGIPGLHLSAKVVGDEDRLDDAILEALTSRGVDVVVLAGYMRKIGPRVLEHYKGRILNIHPALLPKFGGQGMFGMNVHRAVVEAGETESGATIHVVDADYDTGPVLAQAKVPVKPGDTAEDVAARVLKVEHQLFSETLQKIVEGEISLP
jgi:phosphoribosylglycinamide formyltransferase-1